MCINVDFYNGLFFFFFVVGFFFFVGWFYFQLIFVLVVFWFKNVELCMNYYFFGFFGVSLFVWIGYFVYVVILVLCGEIVCWDNFLIILFYLVGFVLFFIGQWVVYVQNLDIVGYIFGIFEGVGIVIFIFLGGFYLQIQSFWFIDMVYYYFVIVVFFIIVGY